MMASPTLRQALQSKYRTLFHTVGNIMALLGAGHLLPLLVIPFYPDERAYIWPFVIPALAGLALGLGLSRWLRSADEPYELSVQDGGVLVLVVWAAAMLLGAMPFLLAGKLNLLNALFESVSGWTTTGLSVMNVDQTPKVFLLWRSLTQYFGALGVVLIALASIIGVSARSLYEAEGRSALLMPNIVRTIKSILGIYVGLTALMTAAYWGAGMSFFDALNHAMCTVSTGGFSSRGPSYAHWDSAWLDVAAILLMLVASTNYATVFLLLRGQWRDALRNREWRLTAALLLVAIPVVVISLSGVAGYGWSGRTLRAAGFETVAALSSTGFTSVTYQGWPEISLLVLTLLMLVGGGSGSTAGGIKQYRIYVLLQAIWWRIKRRTLPRRAVTKHALWDGGQWQEADDSDIAEAASFVALYLLVFIVGVLIFMAYGYSTIDSLFEMASSISTIGLSVGITSATAPAGIRITQMVAMVMGRLELFVVILGGLNIVRDWQLWRRAKRGVR